MKLYALVVGYALVAAFDVTPYDDALFFKRFARNFVLHGTFAWNVADGPIHGNTSQLMQFVATLLFAIGRDHYILLAKVFSAVALFLAYALLARSARRSGGRGWLLLLPWVSPLALGTVHSGMETACALFTLAAFVYSGAWDPSRELQPRRAAALSVLVYLARPDAALIPVTATLIAQRSRPRLLWAYVAWLSAGLAFFLAAFALYYGSALPLSLFWKTSALARYDASFIESNRVWKYRYVLTFAVFCAPSVWVALRGFTQRLLPLLASASLLVLYHAFMTTEVMGYHARLYVPALVPLSLAGAIAWGRFMRRARRAERFVVVVALALATVALYRAQLIETPERNFHLSIEPLLYVSWLTLAALTLLATPEQLNFRRVLPIAAAVTPLFWVEPRWPGALDDRAFLSRFWGEVTTVRGLWDVEACLDPHATIYHSEIGVPGALLPDAKVTDLSGLMNRELTFERPGLDALCLRDRPDAIFLPHRAYTALNRELLAGACLRDYTRVLARSSSPLYVRNDLLPRFRTCARESQQRY